MEIEHFNHRHVLSLSEKKREDRVLCQACDEYCAEGLIYSCRDLCGFSLHESCANLPQELHNPDLHPHPLALYPNSDGFSCCASANLPRGFFVHCHECLPIVLPNSFFKQKFLRNSGDRSCYACRRSCGGFTFGCDKCNFSLDVRCAFIRLAKEERDHPVPTLHFSHHKHPLLLFENIPAHHIKCRVCGRSCRDPKTYGCLRCGFFLHLSCFNLPEVICHPFHPYHPLTLKPIKDEGSRRCNACSHYIHYWHRFAYVCECEINCSFGLHRECTSVIMPAITYEGHDHLLQFNDNIRKNNRGDDELINYCSACKSTCESYGFSCLYCDFNLHHTCGPLPYSIKHKSHIHPLILTNSPAQHEDETDDEFYCDACEEERLDPLLPIYQCIECHFAADIKCVISEVISSLNGEYGDVELRNPLGQLGKVITKDALKEMMQNKYKKQLEPTLSWKDFLSTLSIIEEISLWKTIRAKTTTEKIEAYDHDEIILFSDKAYTQFIKFLNYSEVSHNMFPYDWNVGSHTKEEVINVGDYMTTRKLAPILNHLLSNHGDIGAESMFSPKVKSIYFFMLCECIDRMRNIKVVDITDDRLLGWWRCLETLQLAGFKIEFAFDHLKRVTRAHFGLYVEKHVDNVVDQLDRDFMEITRKLERIKSAKASKSSFIEECLREASVMKKGKAVTSRLL